MATDWNSVKADFEAGKNAGALARKYRQKAAVIKARAQKEGWKSPVDEAGKARTEDSQEMLAQDHRAMWGEIKKSVKKVFSGELKEGLDELKAAKTATEVLANIIKGERQAWGIDAREREESSPEWSAIDIAAQMASITAPSGTDEALDGE